MNKILCVPDLHLKENLGYNDLFLDGRREEKQQILDTIIDSSKDCSKVIFLGDQLNSRTNSPHVIREFVNFLERFDGKELFIIAGNHIKFGDGRSAEDFLSEIKGKNWHIITNKVERFNDLVFCPYFTKSELSIETNEEATRKITEMIGEGKVLFAHHAFSDTVVGSGISVNEFTEPILPSKELLKKFKLIVGGHVHAYGQYAKDKMIICGSVFTNEICEHEKFILKLDEDDLSFEKIKLPCRPIVKLENPTEKDFKTLEKNSILKIFITEQEAKDRLREIKGLAEKFDGKVIIEQLPTERKKSSVSYSEDLLSFDVEKLLASYATERKIDFNKLKSGFDLLKTI